MTGKGRAFTSAVAQAGKLKGVFLSERFKD